MDKEAINSKVLRNFWKEKLEKWEAIGEKQTFLTRSGAI